MTDCGVGSMSVAIKGITMSAPSTTTCVMIESGTVYHFLVPTLIDGSTTSPNISRATGEPPYQRSNTFGYATRLVIDRLAFAGARPCGRWRSVARSSPMTKGPEL
jgi:hypothetical protein